MWRYAQMRRPEWPGIATTVGIVLILTLIVVGSRDDFHLKDWQTVIASFIAVMGGGLAYAGAMAKVNADKEKERQELDRKKLGAYYRLGFALNQVLIDAQVVSDRTSYSMLARPETFSASDLHYLKKPPEIEELWATIEIFPKQALAEINVIRAMFRDMDIAINLIPENYEVKRLLGSSDQYFSKYFKSFDLLRGACRRTIQELNDAITEIETTATR
jgi:hypothetical protein